MSAVHHFHFFIQGNTVICHSDHAALKHLATQQLKDCKVSRWLHRHTLNQCNVQIAFTKGKLNLAADSLSRIPISDQNDRIFFSDITEEFIEKHLTTIVFLPQKTSLRKEKLTNSLSTLFNHTHPPSPPKKKIVHQIRAEQPKDC